MSQSNIRIAALAVLIPFTALTLMGLYTDGLAAIPATITSSWTSLQIYVDLVIAAGVICVWMYGDAKAKGRNPWPWIATTAVIGMFGPLVYLLTRSGED